MANPFPGMNPYLEQPELWHQVYNRLIVAIADDLTPQIAPNYRVSIEERVYTSVDDLLLVGIADVAVTDRQNSGTPLATVRRTEPSRVKVPMPEEVTERFLEVRSTQSKEVISIVEILSPKNKRSKEGRSTYENKRQRILASSTNLIEIDLLRLGEPMSIVGAVDDSYRILISRAVDRPDADLYTFDLTTSIPAIPIPLRAREPEPVIDLQKLVNEIYDRARFDLAIDYSQPLKSG